VVRVHPEYLSGQRLGPLPEDLDNLWRARFRSIADHERHLHLNGTRVVKFYLHLSEAEQRRRFLARLDDPEKNWKFNAGDVTERRFWPEYRKAYSEAIAATSTNESPWYVVPADDKKNARLIISDVIVNTLGKLDTVFPEPSDKEREEMQRYRAELAAQDPS
jgi:polyphosphate kinase 2 (PPK2 family)